jgi:hypothetical protein
VDAIAHEYNPGEGISAKRTPLGWLRFMAGMHTFRAFAGGKPSWMLAYSWDRQAGIKPRDAMLTLACAEVMAGCNDWDPRGHGMAGTNDPKARREIFGWIKRYQDILYSPRAPLTPAGVYFSPSARLASPGAFTESYEGLLSLVLQSHLEFRIITPRNRDAFKGPVLLAPGLTGLAADERAWLDALPARGTRVLDLGAEGRRYLNELEQGFNRSAGDGRLDAAAEASRTDLVGRVRPLLGAPAVEVEAPPWVLASVAEVLGKPRVFLANYRGIRPGKRVAPEPEKGIRVSFAAPKATRIRILPFMGTVTDIPAVRKSGRLTAVLPPLERGAIVWCQ